MLLTTHAELDSLSGGRYRQTIHNRRIARRVDGNLVRLLNRVGPSGDPTLPVGVSELFDFRLRGKLSGQAPVLFVGRGKQSLRLTPLGTNNVNGEALGENGYRYPEAWDGADLSFQVGGHIIRKAITLRSGHPTRFQFRLDSFAAFDPATLSGPEFRIVNPTLDGPNGETIGMAWAVSEIGGYKVLTVDLPPGDYAGWVLDPTLTLQPAAADGVDTMLKEADATNYGTYTELWVGERKSVTLIYRSLIKFDLSTLPDTATITSCTLSTWLTYIGSQWADNNRTLRLYRQKRAWVENQANWNIWSTGNNWAAAGGFGADDCEQTEIGSCAFATTDAANAQKDWVLTPTTKAGLDLGNGWMLKADTEIDDCYVSASSDHATAANRPKLVVVYTEASTGQPMLLRGSYVPHLGRRIWPGLGR